MTTTQGTKRYHSVSEIEPRFAHSQEDFVYESQLSADVPLLTSVNRGEPDGSNTKGDTYSKHETSSVTTLHSELSESFSFQKHSVLPQGWPTSPQPTSISNATIIFRVLVDIALLVFSIAFLVFALYVILYDQESIKSHPQAAKRFEQASKWGPTIYPILYASVLGRGTHAILLWKLQKGERIGTLDILAGSTSLTSTIVSQFHLRMTSCLGLGLVAVWLLSAVGGQSSFRQISFGPSKHSEHADIFYVVPSPYMWNPRASRLKPTLDTVFSAAIISPTARGGSPRDAWGHTKMPRIEYYERTLTAEDEGWYKTENGTSESYSSFIGVPIGGIDSADFIEYSTTIQATYFHLTCDPYFGELHSTFNRSGWLGHLFWNDNTTERVELPIDDLKPFSFVINSTAGHVLNCTIETSYIEVEVTCPTFVTCFASRIRRSRIVHPPAAYTQLQLLTGFLDVPYQPYLGPELADVGGDIGPGAFNETLDFSVSELSDSYLDDPRDLMHLGSTGSSDLDPQTFAIRLGQLLNAYWATMNSKGSLVGRFDIFTYRTNDSIAWSYQDESQSMDLQTFRKSWQFAKSWPSTGTKRSNVEVFHAHHGWVIALIISSTVLITASLIPVYIRTFVSRGPDILMNLSSLATRDNPYVALPTTGTHLDAADRSRYLKDMRIRFGDVEEGRETGRMAIGQLGVDIAALKKGRKYM